MAKRSKKNGGSRSEAKRLREERWRRILSEQERSGLGHTAFCRRKKISQHAYFWWKRELRLRDQKRRRRVAKISVDRPSLVPVRVSTASVIATQTAFEVVLPGQRLVRVPVEFDAESLKRLLAVLEDASC